MSLKVRISLHLSKINQHFTKYKLQEKMLLFNKPKVNEKEMMIQQRKKASFNSKCAKFEGTNEPVLVKKESLTKVRYKVL